MSTKDYQALHEEALRKASELRSQGKQSEAASWSQKARYYRDLITGISTGKVKPSEVPVEEGRDISDVMREAKVKGFEASIEEQLRLWAEGKITQEEFIRRRTALEKTHWAWAEEAEKRGWEATPEEREIVELSVREERTKQYYAAVEDVLTRYAKGELSKQEMLFSLKRLEEAQYQWARKMEEEPTVPEGMKFQVGYGVKEVEFKPPTEAEMHQWREAGFTEAAVKWEKWLETAEGQSWLHQRREAEFTNLTTRQIIGLDPVYMAPELVEGGYAYKWKEVEAPKEDKGVPPVQGPWWVGGPKPGMPGYVLKEAVEKVTDPIGEMIRAWDIPFAREEARIRAKAEELQAMGIYLGETGKPWAGFGEYMKAVGLKTEAAAFAGLTWFIRPAQYTKPLEAAFGLALKPEYRKAIVEEAKRDPFGLFLEIVGGYVGAYTGGKLISVGLEKIGKREGQISRLESVAEKRTEGGTFLKPTVKTKKIPADVYEILKEEQVTNELDTFLGIRRGEGAKFPITRDYGDVLDDLLEGKITRTEAIKGAIESFEGRKTAGVEGLVDEMLPDFGKISKGTFTEEYALNRFGIISGKRVGLKLAEELGWSAYKELGPEGLWELARPLELTRGGGFIDVIGGVKRAGEELEDVLGIVPKGGAKTPFYKAWSWWYPSRAIQLKAMKFINRFTGKTQLALPAPETVIKAVTPISKVSKVGVRGVSELAGVMGVSTALGRGTLPSPYYRTGYREFIITKDIMGEKVSEKDLSKLTSDLFQGAKPLSSLKDFIGEVDKPKPIQIITPIPKTTLKITPTQIIKPIEEEKQITKLIQKQVEVVEPIEGKFIKVTSIPRFPPYKKVRKTIKIEDFTRPKKKKKGRGMRKIWGEERIYKVPTVKELLGKARRKKKK